MQMNTVGFGSLQQAHVAEALAPPGQWLHEIAEHGQVGVHLVALGPTGDQPRLLIDSRIDDVRDVGQRFERLATSLLIPQVDRKVSKCTLAVDLGRAPGYGDDVPPVLEKLIDGCRAHQSTGSRNQHGVRHELALRPITSFQARLAGTVVARSRERWAC